MRSLHLIGQREDLGLSALRYGVRRGPQGLRELANAIPDQGGR
jgi:hypothetical protein